MAVPTGRGPGTAPGREDPQRVNRLYAVLTKVNESIIRIRSRQELFDAACRIAVEDGHFLLAWIGFVDPGTQCIRVDAKYGKDEGYLDGVSIALDPSIPEGQGPTGVALREGRPFVNNDTEHNPFMAPWRDEQLKRGFRSSASFPLKSDDRTIGVITLYAGEAGYFDDEEIRLLTCLADDFAFALQAAESAERRTTAEQALSKSHDELEQRVRDRTAELEASSERNAHLADELRSSKERLQQELEATNLLQRASALYLSEGNLEPVLGEIVEAAIGITEADFGNIQLLDPKSGDLRIAAYRGFPKWWLDFWETVSEGTGVCGTALDRGERVIVEDVRQSPIFIGSEALDIQLKAGILAVQSTPLVSRSGEPLGMFSTHFKAPHRPDERQLQLLDLLARQAADIIERARSERGLAETTQRLTNVLDSMTDAFVSVDREWRYTIVNPKAEALIGRPANELLGSSLVDLYPDMFGWEHYRRVMETGEAESFEVWSKPLETWLEVHAYPTAEGISILFADISERKAAERERERLLHAVEREAAQLDAVFNALPYPVQVHAPDGAYERVNPAVVSLFGFDPIHASRQEIADKVHAHFPDGTPLTPENMPSSRALRGEEVRDVEYVLTDQDGVDHAVVVNAVPFELDGKVQGAVLAQIDMTERKAAEDALRESEERFRALTVASSDVVYRMSPDWSEMRQLRGRGFIADTDEPNRNWLQEYIHPNDQSRVMAVISEAIRTKSVFELEHQVLQVDGTLGWTFSRAIPLLDASGDITEWFGAASDITARRRAEEALRESEARFRQQFETMTEGFSINEIILDAQGKPCDMRYIDVNPAFEIQTGLRAADIVGKTLLELFPDAETQWLERYGKVAITGAPDHWEARFGPLDRWFAVSAYQMSPGRFAVVFFDVTERKTAEEALLTLYESERETARLSDALNGVNKVVHSSLETDEVMQHALDAGVEALGCDAAAIEMFEADEWVVRYQTGFSPEDVGTHLSEQEAPSATRAALEARPVQAEAMPGDEKVNVGFIKKYSLKSVIAVPLFGRGRVVGCALFYASNECRRFTDAEVDFAQKLGSVVSLGLENARLYSIERNTAQTLQSALLTLPESLRGIEFASSYRSATDSTLVGGDFYDLFELDDDRVGITIGDISGKGLGAAVLTSLVKDTIRAHANERAKNPAQVLALTNDLVYRSTPPETFATVFFGVLDRRSGSLSYANAGHTAAMVKSGGTTSKLAVTDPILGGFGCIEFGESETQLDVGEVLFLYTDGLTEARRGAELYGEQRLVELLESSALQPASDVVGEVMADVMSFAGGHLRDDLAILAIRRLESSAPASEP